MPINLSNVNISLQQFQDISSGKYNAGEIKLTSENSLGKINNHVTLTRLNTTSLGIDEVLSLKDALVRTLRDNGVSEQTLAKLRVEIGLDRNGASDTKLFSRSIKPLSRQQVRNILDKCADEINRANGPGTIASSRTIYGDVPRPEMADRELVRDEINASLDAKRTVAETREFDLFHSVVTGVVAYRPKSDVQDLLRIAKAQRDEILAACNNSPRDTPCRVTCSIGGGAGVSMAPAMSEKDYLKRLDDMIRWLESDDGKLHDDTADTLREFDGCRTEAERKEWIVSNSSKADGARKLRTAAIKVLYDRGINDYATLSLINKLHRAVVSSLLLNLVTICRMDTADELRRSHEMSMLPLLVGTKVPDAEKALLPVLPPEQDDAPVKDGAKA